MGLEFSSRCGFGNFHRRPDLAEFLCETWRLLTQASEKCASLPDAPEHRGSSSLAGHGLRNQAGQVGAGGSSAVLRVGQRPQVLPVPGVRDPLAEPD
jgi:hypothetical protein